MTDRTRTCTLPTVDFIVCCVLIMVRDDKSIPWTVLSVYQLVGASATPLQSHHRLFLLDGYNLNTLFQILLVCLHSKSRFSGSSPFFRN